MSGLDVQEGVGPLALSGRPRRLVPFVLGWEVIAESVSLAGGSSFRHLLEPVTGAAIVYDDGWILVDGGFDPTRVRDGASRARYFDYLNYAPVVPTVDPLVEQVATAGLAWDRLAALIVTHAHFDHTGGARMLAPHQPLILQHREWKHVQQTHDERSAFLIRADLERSGLRIALVDGDVEIAPGVRVIDTSGHTPGHQSVVVELPGRTVVLAGDAADLHTNVVEAIPCGSTVGADGATRAAAAIARLREWEARDDAEVWPAHDPSWGPWRDAIDHAAAVHKAPDASGPPA